jgi:Cu/Ag efflux protein CusF
MKRQLHDALLCAALLATVLVPGRAIAADNQPNKFNEAKKQDLEYTGSITAINTNAAIVTVKSKEKEAMTLSLAKDCMLFVKHKKAAAALSDFKVGEEVRVLYKQEGGALVCDSMWEPGSNPGEKVHKIQKQEK